MLSKFSLVFINTAISSEIVNHASTVNVFSCKNSRFQLPQNFISQIDRGSIALSLEYCLSNESHVSHACTRKGFSPFKNRKIDGRDNADLEGNFEKILKNQIEIF